MIQVRKAILALDSEIVDDLERLYNEAKKLF